MTGCSRMALSQRMPDTLATNPSRCPRGTGVGSAMPPRYRGSMAAGIDRIAFVSMHTSPVAQPGSGDAGGMNVTLLALAAELAVRDVSVELVTRAVGEPGVRELLPGVTLHELAAGGHGVLPKAELRTATDEFGEGFAELARRSPVGIVHAHYWLSGLATLPVALELGVPFVQSFHTLSVMKTGKDGAAERHDDLHRLRAENFLAGQADAVVAGSSAEAAVLIDGVGAPDRTAPGSCRPASTSSCSRPRGRRSRPRCGGRSSSSRIGRSWRSPAASSRSRGTSSPCARSPSCTRCAAGRRCS